MRQFLVILVALLILQSVHGQSKVEEIAKEFCRCFDSIDLESKSEAGRQLNKCIKSDLKSKTRDAIKSNEEYIEFVKIMGKNCTSFLKFTTKYYEKDEKLTSEEHTENLAFLINYFRQPSEYGQLPKSVNIGVGEVGLRYNKLQQKTYIDSVYKTGFHVIQPSDSLVRFDIKEKSIELEMDCLTKHGLSLNLNQIVRYVPKSDSIGKLIENFGASFERVFIIPETRMATRMVIRNLSSSQLYNLDDSELTSRIIDAIKSKTQLINYFDIRFLKITNIEFPHILKEVEIAGLMKTYELLQSEDIDKRLEAIKKLLKDKSRTSYLVILEHWRNETDKNVQKYILDSLSE